MSRYFGVPVLSCAVPVFSVVPMIVPPRLIRFEFETTEAFVDGSGKTYPAGTNVAYTENFRHPFSISFFSCWTASSDRPSIVSPVMLHYYSAGITQIASMNGTGKYRNTEVSGQDRLDPGLD